MDGPDRGHPVCRIIDDLGGAAKLAERLSREAERFSPGTIGAWKCRRSIPVRYWPKLVAAAENLKVNSVTNDALVSAHIPPAVKEGGARER